MTSTWGNPVILKSLYNSLSSTALHTVLGQEKKNISAIATKREGCLSTSIALASSIENDLRKKGGARKQILQSVCKVFACTHQK